MQLVRWSQPRLFLVCASAVLAAPLVATADDWPQWRGPTRDGVWRETGILERFPEEGLVPRWRVAIGSGYSGPTVADGRVFLFDRLTDPRPQERIQCFDWKTGQRIWSYAYDCAYDGIGYHAGPRASITVYDGRAYALGAMGHLHCFDAGTGALLWKKVPGRDYNIRLLEWGVAPAPIIVGDLVIVMVGAEENGCVIAFHRKDGDEVWRALDERASYAAPILTEQAGQDVLVCWTGDSVTGLDPRRGRRYWRVPFPPDRWVIGIATPVQHGDRLFITSVHEGALMLRMLQDRVDVETLWRRRGTNERDTDALQSLMSTPVFDGDYLYGVDSHGELRCLRADTGDRVWEDLTAAPQVRWSTVHIVRNADRYFLFNEQGELLIGRLTPAGFEEIDRARLIRPTLEQLRRRDGVTWSHPAYAYRHVFARNDEELVCVSLEAR